jgi:DNA-binding transcriptional LysR family regulator
MNTLELVASPHYWDRRGRPGSLDGLAGHVLLNYTHSPFGDEIHFGAGGAVAIRFRSVLRCCSNETTLQMAAREGMRVTFLPT